MKKHDDIERVVFIRDAAIVDRAIEIVEWLASNGIITINCDKKETWRDPFFQILRDLGHKPNPKGN